MQLGCCRPIIYLLLLYHFLISVKLTGIDSVQIQKSLVPKGTTPVFQSPEILNWVKPKRNWEIPISDKNPSVFILLYLKHFHLHKFLKVRLKSKLNNQHRWANQTLNSISRNIKNVHTLPFQICKISMLNWRYFWWIMVMTNVKLQNIWLINQSCSISLWKIWNISTYRY